MKTIRRYALILLICAGFISNSIAQNNNYFSRTFTITFPNGEANKVVYINFPNVGIWGNLKVTLSGGYDYQLNIGELTKTFSIIYNVNSAFIQETEISSSYGSLASQWAIGDFDKTNMSIPIYHLVSSGNQMTIRVEGQLLHTTSVNSIESSLQLSSIETYSSTQNKQYVCYKNNVGIGTTTPSENLHIKGNLFIEGTEAYENGWKKNYLFWRGHSLIMGSKPGVYAHNRIELKPGGASQGKLVSSLHLYDANNIDDQTLKIQIASSGATYFNGGNVGIGTNNPSHALDVNGTIHTQEVKVDMNGWSDFVFHPTYNLRPLQEVKTYIQQNGHLPEIPTAKEVEENGVSLGEMNAKLLQKIEELTLYVIDLQNQVNEQSLIIEKLIQE